MNELKITSASWVVIMAQRQLLTVNLGMGRGGEILVTNLSQIRERCWFKLLERKD